MHCMQSQVHLKRLASQQSESSNALRRRRICGIAIQQLTEMDKLCTRDEISKLLIAYCIFSTGKLEAMELWESGH